MRTLRPSYDLHEEEPLINLTALIDVVFVILIMFIVIAPLLELEKIDLATAGSKEILEVKEGSPLFIHVTKNNEIFLNKELVSSLQLTENLIVLKNRYPNAPLQLFQDKNGSFGTYMQVKNAAENAGFDTLDLVLNPS